MLTLQLLCCMKSTKLLYMRRMCAQLRTFLLLAVALTVAAHPLVRSLSPSLLLANEYGADAQVVICTSHGPVVLDNPSGMPEPAKQDARALEPSRTGGSSLQSPPYNRHARPPQLLPRYYAGINSDCD